MTQDEIIKLIETNGLNLHGDIEHFAALVAAHEREECAKVVEDLFVPPDEIADFIVEKIRARGEA